MGRHAAGPKILIRGKKPVLYTEFADGRGKKVCVRIRDEKGRLVSPTAPEHQIKAHAWRIFNDRRSAVENNDKRKRTVGELTLRYVDKRSNGWSTGTRKRYVSYLEQLDAHLDPVLSVEEITMEVAEDLLDRVAESTGWKSGTQERFYWFCRGVFNYGRDLGWIAGNPFALITPPKIVPEQTEAPFSEDEIKQLLAVACTQFGWMYPAIVVAVTAGPRRSELCALRVGDYNRDLGVIHFPAQTTKTQKDNDVVLPPFARAALDACVEGRNPKERLFIKPSGKPLRSKDFDLSYKPGRDAKRAWRKLLEAANLKLRGVHKLRSALVTNLVNQGRFSIEEVTSITGQSPEVAKQHYLKHRTQRQKPLVEHMESVYGAITAPPGSVSNPHAVHKVIGHAFEEL